MGVRSTTDRQPQAERAHETEQQTTGQGTPRSSSYAQTSASIQHPTPTHNTAPSATFPAAAATAAWPHPAPTLLHTCTRTPRPPGPGPACTTLRSLGGGCCGLRLAEMPPITSMGCDGTLDCGAGIAMGADAGEGDSDSACRTWGGTTGQFCQSGRKDGKTVHATARGSC